MKNLTLNLEEEIILLKKYNISCNELMFIRSLLILQEDGKEEIFRDYLDSLHLCHISIKELLKSIQEKGIILKSFNIPEEGEIFDPYSIPINKVFIRNLYKGSFEIGKELFDTYPQFGNIQGNVVGLRSISKKFDSLEDAYFKYGKSINWNIDKHNYIIELLKWANENNIINYTLASFIVDQRWLELESLKNGDIANVNYDTIKLL